MAFPFAGIPLLGPLVQIAAVALLVTILGHARDVFIPLALAVLLSFILSPAVNRLERWRVPRFLAAVLMVALTLGVLGALGWALTSQVQALGHDLPGYSTSISKKLAALRRGPLTTIQNTVEEVSQNLEQQQKKVEHGETEVQLVRLAPGAPTPIAVLGGLVPFLAPLATTGIVLVLATFMLVQREDLRDRVIRLAGRGRVTLTTKAMDEAAWRISRYLLVQSTINAGFGAAVGLGLYWIGVPYALLWGVVSGILRFVPYVGSLVAMLAAMAVAFVQFDGWRTTVETLALYLGVEALVANAIEPLVIGRHTGVSALALLVSALFWTWLWGPIGLALSTPLTVCLAVLGKHVPDLAFLAVLLGDEPVLEPEITFYQRLLAGDEDEAREILEREVEAGGRAKAFDTVVVPALVLCERHRRRDELSDSERDDIVREIRDILRDLPAPSETPTPAEGRRGSILGVAPRTETDALGLEMLGQLLDTRCALVALSPTTLASEVLATVARDVPDVVCVAALSPGGTAQVRYLCKKLRQTFPALRILVLRPGGPAEQAARAELAKQLGADEVVPSLADAATDAARLAAAGVLASSDTQAAVSR